MAERVLIVDDDPLARRAMVAALSSLYELSEAQDVAEAWLQLEKEVFHLLITDVRMPGSDGVDLVRRLREQGLSLPVIVVSAHDVVAELAQLLELGVTDCLRKPMTPSDLRLAVARAFELRRLDEETRRLRGERQPARGLDLLLGESPAMLGVKEQITRVASTDTTVLVLGETGTGKELVARAVHAASPRAGQGFVAVNCGSLDDQLVESTLFGHAKGAFTGATEARPGCFETAGGGTVLLDEIGTLSLPLQVRLLRVLSSGEVRRLGESRGRPLDCRIVAATNADLPEVVRRGGFREDLFHRIAAFPIRLPSLRERGDGDLCLLAGHLLQKACTRLGRPSKRLSDAALAELRAHSWPGNVRELENAMERAVLLAGDEPTVEAGHVLLRPPPADGRTRTPLPEGGLDLRRRLADEEAALMRQALERSGGSQAAAARLLGIPASTLGHKLRELEAGGDGAGAGRGEAAS